MMKPISEETRTKLAYLTIGVLVIAGLYILVFYGIIPLQDAEDVYKTFKSQHPDQPTKIILPSSIGTADERSDIQRFDMSFTTDDVFSANNPIHLDMQVILLNPKVSRIFILESAAPIDTSLILQKNIDRIIATYKQAHEAFQLNRTAFNLFTGSNTITPIIEGKIFLVAYVITNVNDTTTGIEHFPLGFAFNAQNGDDQAALTISPASQKILAETNRQITNSNAETAHSNSVVSSLTFVIIGLVPLGLSIELFVHKWLIK